MSTTLGIELEKHTFQLYACIWEDSLRLEETTVVDEHVQDLSSLMTGNSRPQVTKELR